MLLATIPKKEYAEGATDLDLALGEPKMERALGVQWYLSSDKFQFRVEVKQNHEDQKNKATFLKGLF